MADRYIMVGATPGGAAPATTDFTAGSAGWTLDAGGSGRGAASRSGAGLSLEVALGASVPYDANNGFAAPRAYRTLPSGGMRGVAAEVVFGAPSAVGNRTGLFFRDAARSFTFGVHHTGDSGVIEVLLLAPAVSLYSPAGATLAGVRGLALRLEGGMLAAYVTTAPTPTEADWRYVGNGNVGNSAAVLGRALDVVEIAHATYDTVASSVVIASASVRALP